MKQLRQCLFLSLLCWAAALFLPMLVCAAAALSRSPVPDAPLPSPPAEGMSSPAETESVPVPAETESAECTAGQDASTLFPVRFADGSVREVSMADFLPGVIAGEMPASFTSDALRAQAVAGRTYILACMQRSRSAHGSAAVCTDPGCCQAWLSEEELRERWGEEYPLYEEKITDAVRSTDGMCLYWEDEPILACFHASSLRCTEDSGSVWTDSLPYLVSVSSPESIETVPDLVTTVDVTAQELRAAVESLAPAVFPEDPALWPGTVSYDRAGRVAGMMLAGVWVRGDDLRELFSLRSTDFTLVWTGEGFRFTVAGYGHGVGMSQYGAELMAEAGESWQEILSHYYPGAELRAMGEK